MCVDTSRYMWIHVNSISVCVCVSVDVYSMLIIGQLFSSGAHTEALYVNRCVCVCGYSKCHHLGAATVTASQQSQMKRLKMAMTECIGPRCRHRETGNVDDKKMGLLKK